MFLGSDYERGVRDALSYVTSRARRSAEFNHVDRKFLFVARGGESSLPESSGLLDDLVDAVLHSRYADIEYFHFDGRRETARVQPLSMAIYDHQIYLIAGAGDGTRHPFRLSRIKSVDVGNQTFDYPERAVYDPKQLFRDTFGIFISDVTSPVRVRVRLDSAWRVHCRTHKWHASQHIEEVPGGIIVSLVVRVCWELKAWILGFGADAVVLEPLILVEEIRNIATQMAARYATPDLAIESHTVPARPPLAAPRVRGRKVGS